MLDDNPIEAQLRRNRERRNARIRFAKLDDEGFPRCWRCGHFDFGPCPNGVLLCNGCDAANRVPKREK